MTFEYCVMHYDSYESNIKFNKKPLQCYNHTIYRFLCWVSLNNTIYSVRVEKVLKTRVEKGKKF